MTTPTDDDFDNMHHALGRPAGCQVEPYRNYFAIERDTETARRFELLGHYWQRGGTAPGGLTYYSVTPHGIANVMAWLELRQRAEGKRPWLVGGGGYAARVVIAKSPSAAKYQVYLEADPPHSFGQFLRSGICARAA